MSEDLALTRFFKIIEDEIRKNPDFRRKLIASLIPILEFHEEGTETDLSSKRPTHRRTPATLDPLSLIKNSEYLLREELRKLSLEQLRDIVAQYGMDTGKLVMKWKDIDRVINRIVELSKVRSQKGSAFREQVVDKETPPEDG